MSNENGSKNPIEEIQENSPKIPEDLNNDAGLASVLSMLSTMSRVHNDESCESIKSPKRLSHSELNNLFRSSKLIRKIVCLYPEKAESTGYEIKDKKGNIINTSDPIIVEAFKEASIFSRLYGKSLLIFDFKSKDKSPLKYGEEILDYKISTTLRKEGEFFHLSGNETTKIHESKALIFLGEKNYIENSNINDDNYSDSIIQGIYESFMDYLSCNRHSQYLLENLSYLVVGIDRLADKSRTTLGSNEVFDRLRNLNENRRINRVIAHDKIGETVSFISQTLSGVQDIIASAKEYFLAETQYPSNIIFEESGNNGLSSGMQNQLAGRFLWQKTVCEWTKNHWQKNYITFFSRLIQNFDQYQLSIPFKMDLNLMEQADFENKSAERIQKLINSSVISPVEARFGYSGKEFSLNINLDDKEYREFLNSQNQKGLKTLNSPQEKHHVIEKAELIEKQTEIGNEIEGSKKPNQDSTDPELTDLEYDSISNISLAEIEEYINSLESPN